MRILVIDDDLIVLEFIRKLLADEGYDCDCFSSCAQALDCYKDKNHELVITDYLIADISGLFILRETKAINPDVKIIVISGLGDVEDAVIKEGACQYLRKPLDAFILVRTISQVLN